MKKVDPTVRKETLYILICCIIGSLLMESVFLIIGEWNYTVLLGNLLGLFAAVGNFFLMGLTVQKALEKDEKSARDHMKLSQSLRFLGLVAIAAVGYLLSLIHVMNVLAVVIPYLFPRIAIAFRPLFNKKMGGESGE